MHFSQTPSPGNGGTSGELLSLLILHLLGLLGWSLEDSALLLTVHRPYVFLAYFPVPTSAELSA